MYISKKAVIPIFLLFGLMCRSQEVNLYLNKTLISKVGSTYMETSEPDSCAGNSIYAKVEINKSDLFIWEVTVSSCGEEEVLEIGKYNWKESAGKIIIDYDSKETGYMYAKIIFLELANNKVTGKVLYPNGKVESRVFDLLKK